MLKDVKKYMTSLKKRHILIMGMLAIGAFAIFGNNGLITVYKLRKERDGILAYNRSVEKENRDLERRITLLKTDKRYIEHIAKKELGMIGRNEVVYRIDPQK